MGGTASTMVQLNWKDKQIGKFIRFRCYQYWRELFSCAMFGAYTSSVSRTSSNRLFFQGERRTETRMRYPAHIGFGFLV